MKFQSLQRLSAILPETARFFAVVCVGAGIDLMLGYAAVSFLGFPLPFAAVCGFVAAGGSNYVMLELWGFHNQVSHLSGDRALRYLVVALVTLFVRIAVVLFLSLASNGHYKLATLVSGASASFFVNFYLSKIFVYQRQPVKVCPEP